MKYAFVAAVLCAGAAQAQVYTGNYGLADQDGACYPYPDGQIDLQTDRIIFYESACGLSNPRLLPGMGGAVQYRLLCSGEGETWETEAVLMQSDAGGLIIIRPGSAFEYARC